MKPLWLSCLKELLEIRIKMDEQKRFEQLSIFLPYGVKCHAMGKMVEGTEYNDEPQPQEFTIKGSFTDQNKTRYVEIWDGKEMDEAVISDCFPIFRPMGDFFKDIEHEGVNFNPAEEVIAKGEHNGLTKEYLGTQLNIIRYEWDTNILDYWIVNLLAQWHFDINGWIDSKDAISIHDNQVTKWKKQKI
jgi:hypothetical protein